MNSAALGHSLLWRRPADTTFLQGLSQQFLCLRQQVIDGRIVAKEADFELRRIFHQLLHVPSRGSNHRNHHRNVTHANANVLLGVGVQIQTYRATTIGENRSAEPTPITFLNDAVLDFCRPSIFELVYSHRSEVLVQGVWTTAASRKPVISDQKRSLINTVDIGGLGEQVGQLHARDARERECCGQNVGKVEEAVRPARFHHALPVGKGGYTYTTLPT